VLKSRLYAEYRIEVPRIEWQDRHFVRISIQGYNTQADIDALLVALKTLLPQVACRRVLLSAYIQNPMRLDGNKVPYKSVQEYSGTLPSLHLDVTRSCHEKANSTCPGHSDRAGRRCLCAGCPGNSGTFTDPADCACGTSLSRYNPDGN
jgi:hypothetical protein